MQPFIQIGRFLKLSDLTRLGFWIAIHFALPHDGWAQSRPVLLPSLPNPPATVTPTVTPTVTRIRGLHPSSMGPKIPYSVAPASMATWRRLVGSLPPECFQADNLHDQILRISAHLNLPVEIAVPLDRLKSLDVFKQYHDRTPTWFSELADRLADGDLQITIDAAGLHVRPIAETPEAEADPNALPGAFPVVYYTSTLGMKEDDLWLMLVHLVNPEQWEDNGGYGRFDVTDSKDGQIVFVLHRPDVQASVHAFLEALAEISVAPPGTSAGRERYTSVRGDGIRCWMPPTTRSLHNFFDSPTPEALRRPLTLNALIEELRRRGVPVHHDLYLTAQANSTGQTWLDLRRSHGSFYNDLKLALLSHEIRMSVARERVEFLDLTERNDSPSYEWLLYDTTALQTTPESLSRLLMMSIAPDEWDENGGGGSLGVATVGNRQVVAVRQTPTIQRQVRRFLERLGDFLLVTASSPAIDLGSYPSTPIPLPNRYVPAKSVSQPVQFPSETATSSRQPQELTAESWPAHELQVDFRLPSKDSDELDKYPIFYDLTPLGTTPAVVYEMLFQLVDPESWEENGGDSASVIEQCGRKRILFVRTTGPHHDAIARFFAGLSQAVGIAPLRSNWQFEWVPPQVLAARRESMLQTGAVRVFLLPRSGLNFDTVRYTILETMEPDSWSENGGDFELMLTRINDRDLLVVHQSPAVLQKIEQSIRIGF